MRKAKLGSKGPEISVVGYGAWEAGGMAWGDNPPDAEVLDAMHAAFDSGIDWVDTAEVYGGGRSEELVGEAVSGYDDVMVFTKVAPKPAGTGFSKDEIRQACEKSLSRLERDRIDLYQLHWRTDDVPVEETWEAMAELADEGLVRWIGVSNFDRGSIERCEKIRHVDSLQPQFSMLWREGLDDLFPYCEANGTGIIAYGPLAYGMLSGRIAEDTEFGDNDWRSGKHGMHKYYNHLFAPDVRPKRVAQVRALQPIADRLGVTLPQLALAWVVHQSPVTGAIAGSRSAEHVRENAAAGDVEIGDKDLEEISSILGSDG